MADNPKILVIDDEPAVREMLRAALESWGYVADTAATGAVGLEQFKKGSYAVVLTDYLMPGMTGVEVAREIRRVAPRVQVIIITGSALDEQLDAARRLNFTILRKPVDLVDLKASIDRAAAG